MNDHILLQYSAVHDPYNKYSSNKSRIRKWKEKKKQKQIDHRMKKNNDK